MLGYGQILNCSNLPAMLDFTLFNPTYTTLQVLPLSQAAVYTEVGSNGKFTD